MTFAQIHEPYREATAARNIARSLSHWHVMDMTLVARKGSMRVGAIRPAGATGQLIHWHVLDFVERPDGFALVKGPRFEAVCKASKEIAQAQDRGMVL